MKEQHYYSNRLILVYGPASLLGTMSLKVKGHPGSSRAIITEDIMDG